MYFEDAQVKLLVLTLHDRFPGAELVFDTCSSFMRWAYNLKVARTNVGVSLHWALKHAQDIEQWDSSVRRLSQCYTFYKSELRPGAFQIVRFIPFVSRTVRIVHYRPGEAAG